ncbi:MAG TPA: GPR1/FUN34/YaaH family transporter [Stellaceae bacterium]|nr:GPR1/FUN34/YaaH family transporter [Stellaceae bacterium]
MANIAPLEEHESWTKAGPVVSHMSEHEIVSLEEQAMATVGDPTPMGLWAFATGTWILGTVFGGVFPAGTITGTAPVLITFAGIAQFIAGLFAYRRAQPLAATAFCSFGAFNATAGFMFLMITAGAIGATASSQILMGFLLESFCFIAIALAFAAIETNLGVLAFLVLLAIGYGCAGIPYLANSVGAGGWGVVGNIGGWFLCASAFCAYYTGMAMVVNSTWKRAVLPIWGRP